MGIIKQIRAKSGYTQEALSKKTGLSLRTVQRLDITDKAPKGHTLKVLAEAFGVSPVDLKEKYKLLEMDKEDEILSMKIINLSVFAFFGIPFGNLIVPILLWRRKRHSKLVDEMGRKIINFQIIWSVVLCFSLMIAPFVDYYVYTRMSLILIVLFTMMAINVVVVTITAQFLHRKKLDFLNLHIRLI